MPASLWENGFIESFNARLRNELPDGKIFYSLAEAQRLIEAWKIDYNEGRPYMALGNKMPAEYLLQVVHPLLVQHKKVTENDA